MLLLMARDITSMLGLKVAKPLAKTKLNIKSAQRKLSGCLVLPFSARWRVEGSHCITNFPQTTAFAEYVKARLDSKSLKLGCFDLDGTLVNTKSGANFARGSSDWCWFENAKDKVTREVEKGTILVIFTNQGGVTASQGEISKSYTNLKERINLVVASLGKTVEYPLVLAAPKRPGGKQKVISSAEKHEKMRKPATGMFERMEEFLKDALGEYSIDKEQSYYVGDAAGRELDFLDSDKAFAEAVGLPFHTPEEFFK